MEKTASPAPKCQASMAGTGGTGPAGATAAKATAKAAAGTGPKAQPAVDGPRDHSWEAAYIAEWDRRYGSGVGAAKNALEDYQTQLLLLEQQNKRRLMRARDVLTMMQDGAGINNDDDGGGGVVDGAKGSAKACARAKDGSIPTPLPVLRAVPVQTSDLRAKTQAPAEDGHKSTAGCTTKASAVQDGEPRAKTTGRRFIPMELTEAQYEEWKRALPDICGKRNPAEYQPMRPEGVVRPVRQNTAPPAPQPEQEYETTLAAYRAAMNIPTAGSTTPAPRKAGKSAPTATTQATLSHEAVLAEMLAVARERREFTRQLAANEERQQARLDLLPYMKLTRELLMSDMARMRQAPPPKGATDGKATAAMTTNAAAQATAEDPADAAPPPYWPATMHHLWYQRAQERRAATHTEAHAEHGCCAPKTAAATAVAPLAADKTPYTAPKAIVEDAFDMCDDTDSGDLEDMAALLTPPSHASSADEDDDDDDDDGSSDAESDDAESERNEKPKPKPSAIIAEAMHQDAATRLLRHYCRFLRKTGAGDLNADEVHEVFYAAIRRADKEDRPMDFGDVRASVDELKNKPLRPASGW